MQGLITTALFLLVCLVVYRYRGAIGKRLRRFDEKNVARHAEEARDRSDRLAHFKHTLRLAEEQVEEIGEISERDARTGQAVTRYAFEGEIFATRDEAEAARQNSIVAKARDFYVELPAALSRRGDSKLR
jgi:hypothetical protein